MVPLPLPLPPPAAPHAHTHDDHQHAHFAAIAALPHAHSHSHPHAALGHAHALPVSMHTVAHAVSGSGAALAALPAAPGTVPVPAAHFQTNATMHMQSANAMHTANAQTHGASQVNGHGHANGQSGFAQAAVAHPHHYAATLSHAHPHTHSHSLAQQHHLAVPVQGAMHASPVKAVLATATTAPATPARAHPVQAYAAHTLPSPSVNPMLARRQSSTSGSAEKVVMMATIVDSGPGGGTANGSSPGHTLNAPRPTTQQQRHVSPLPKLVSATLLDESKAHAHLTLPGHAPASHTQGQAIPFQRPAPPSVRIVTATIVSPTTTATPAVVPVKNGVSAAAVMAKPVPAMAVMASTPANATPASAVPRQRQRIRKRAGRPAAAAAPASSRKKLTVPDPLDQVEEGVTRCICGSGEDDGFMICCEGCSAWQHGDCVGLSPDAVPDEYYCDLCDPDGDLHVAQREERRRAKEEHAEFGLAADGKRRRRKRSRMSLGKKRRRGSATATPSSTGHHTRQGSRGAIHTAMHDDDDDGGGSGDSGGSSQSEGEEDEMDDDEDEGFRRAHAQSGAAQGSRRNSGKHGQAATAAHHGPTAAGALHLDTSSPSLSASGGSSTLTSPLYSGASVGGASHGSVGAHFMLSPTSTAAAATLAGATVQLPGQSHPNGGSGNGGGGGGGSNNGSHTVPTSGEVTPAASPTGETKLRSLIFTMEQLANGQMTSPVSTSASLSLSQLARFNYPPGSTLPGPPGVNGSAFPSPTGSPGVGGANGGLISPFPLVRQVSENTANVAMTLQQGFSLPNGGGSGSSSGGGGSHVVLEAFSPVLPASLMGTATSNVLTGPIPPAPASFAALPPSALSAHGPGPAPVPAAGGDAAASAESPALAPSPAQSPADSMLLSPNTQAAVSTLASAIPIVSAN